MVIFNSLLKQHKLASCSLLMLFVWPLLLTTHYIENTTFYFYLYIFLIYINYSAFLAGITKGKRIVRNITTAGAVQFFVISNLLLILAFAFGWQFFNLFGTNNQCLIDSSLIDAIYLSITIFATEGFGDLLPCNDYGKILFIAEAFIGLAHFGVFFTLILQRVVRI